MAAAINDGLLMLVIMNPFAQMVYLSTLINETSSREFSRIYIQASGLALGVFFFCAFAGDFILARLFHVTPESMRIFGGLINLQLAYTYVMKGPEGLRLFSGDVTQLAQQIALPFMVGAGTVWVSMKIGQDHPAPVALLVITTVMSVNALAVLGYQYLFNSVDGRAELRIVKYFGMAMRFNALLMGALSVNMILDGIKVFMAS